MRRLMMLVAMMGLSLSGGARADDVFGPVAGPAAAKSFKLGKLELVVLHDAQFIAHNDAKIFGVDVGPAAVAEVLKANSLPDDRVTLSVNILLVRSGRRVLLLDSGLGPKANGGLMESVKAAGVSPDEITDVLITHSHGDHVGGLVDAKGNLAFPKATIRMATAEWTYMKSLSVAAELVKEIDGHVQTFTPGAPIAPGIRSVALNGHTPGHVGYEISSGRQRLLDIGDLAHSSLLSLKRPDWTMGFDNDPAVAKATRRATLTRLAKDQELVFAPHFPFPGVGHIAADGDAFSWVPGTP
jgi:glyoxylase-like metal-dependent hydrolase (beta-lactamase superfamily II)